ncbi:MAG: ABC transporter permease [SAR202 cluster bacterium]|jgi:peptide/nickel transport system permease protein|nr:ABC transporter permease [SAR202 cluster bacterium]
MSVATPAWVDERADVRKSRGMVRTILSTFARNRTALLGVIIILVLSLAAVFAPLISPTDPLHMDFDALMQSPSRDHPAGTDSLGRDNLSRIIWGGRVSLQVGVLSMAIATVIGVSAGLAAGYYGRWIDTIIMRIVDAILAFPALLLAILMVAVLGPSLRNAMLAIAVAFIPSFARVTRANTLSIREKEYVEGARAIGASAVRIMLRTILPNTLSTVIVQVSLGMSYAILIEAGLSFLGLGIQPPTPSWGYMLATGREFITLAWWLTTFPGLAIFVTVLSWNFIGDGLREALDPRQQRR